MAERANNKDREPRQSWPMPGDADLERAERFRVPSQLVSGTFYSSIMGFRLDGVERYYCMECADRLYKTPQAAAMHRGHAHPSVTAVRRRRRVAALASTEPAEGVLVEDEQQLPLDDDEALDDQVDAPADVVDEGQVDAPADVVVDDRVDAPVAPFSVFAVTAADLAAQLRADIIKGRYPLDSVLPTLGEFKRRGYRERTARGAVTMLKEEGLVQPTVGRGPVVIRQPGRSQLTRKPKTSGEVAAGVKVLDPEKILDMHGQDMAESAVAFIQNLAASRASLATRLAEAEAEVARVAAENDRLRGIIDTIRAAALAAVPATEEIGNG